MGSSRPSRRRLAQPVPGPAGGIFKITGPRPTRSVRFQSRATSARPGQRVSNLTGHLPGLPREILRIFSLFSCCVSFSRFRGSNVLVSPGPAASLGSCSFSTIGIRSSLPCPYTGVRIPLVRLGLRSALIRHISSHDKMSRIVILFFEAKAKNVMTE